MLQFSFFLYYDVGVVLADMKKWYYLVILAFYLGRVKRIWYLLPTRAAIVQASLRIRAVSPEPPLLAHTSSESRGTFKQKSRSLAPLNGWACAVMCVMTECSKTQIRLTRHILFYSFIKVLSLLNFGFRSKRIILKAFVFFQFLCI